MNRVIAVVSIMFTLGGCRSAKPTDTLGKAGTTPQLIAGVEVAPGKFDGAGGYSIFDDRNEFEALETEIAQADFKFDLDERGRLTRENNRSGTIITLPLSPAMLPDAVGIRHAGTYTGFVVVQLDKPAQMDAVEQRVSRVNDYFFHHGARRVLITGYRGSGKSIYSDKITRTNKSSRDNRLSLRVQP